MIVGPAAAFSPRVRRANAPRRDGPPRASPRHIWARWRHPRRLTRARVTISAGGGRSRFPEESAASKWCCRWRARRSRAHGRRRKVCLTGSCGAPQRIPRFSRRCWSAVSRVGRCRPDVRGHLCPGRSRVCSRAVKRLDPRLRRKDSFVHRRLFQRTGVASTSAWPPAPSSASTASARNSQCRGMLSASCSMRCARPTTCPCAV